MSSARNRRRNSSEKGGRPSITLFRSLTSRIRSTRSASSRSHGLACSSVGPFPKSVILLLYHLLGAKPAGKRGTDTHLLPCAQPFTLTLVQIGQRATNGGGDGGDPSLRGTWPTLWRRGLGPSNSPPTRPGIHATSAASSQKGPRQAMIPQISAPVPLSSFCSARTRVNGRRTRANFQPAVGKNRNHFWTI
jgi:hypothetical protein